MFDLEVVTAFANKATQSGARTNLYKFFKLEESGDNFFSLLERLYNYVLDHAEYFYLSNGINGVSYSQVEGIPLADSDYGFLYLVELLKECLTEQLVTFEFAPFVQLTDSFCTFEYRREDGA
jgi:hypothetical protein